MMRGGQEPRSPATDIPTTRLFSVRSEFLEMPGLRLTICQAARLWGLEGTLTEDVLARLEGAGFLERDQIDRICAALEATETADDGRKTAGEWRT